MWINNILRSTLFSFVICGITACGNSAQPTKVNQESQQKKDILFKQAENLLDLNKPYEAFKILKNLADNGDAKAQNAIGNGYEYGFWGDVNLKEAEYWYRKAAQQNYIKAIHNVGIALFLQKKYKDALPYFKKSADMNHADSINMLGVYYSESIIFKQNYKKALEYFDRALDIDPNNSSAQFNVGQAYYYGQGVQQDYQKAFAWYVQAANQDYSLAQIQLAEMYFSGKGVEKDVAKAIEIIKPLAELGDEKAKSNLQWYLDHPN